MTRDFKARLARLENGPSSLEGQCHRAEWWKWRGTPHSTWPEAALEAFTRSGDAGDPECGAEIQRMADDDLNWCLRRLLRRAGLWTLEMEAGLPEMPDLTDLRRELKEDMADAQHI